MKHVAAILALLPILLGACAENAFYVTGVPDGSTTVDRSYYGFTASVRSGGSEVTSMVEVKIAVKAFDADGKLRVCGAYGTETDDFHREAVISAFSRQSGGLVFGKDSDAVSLPFNFMAFNDIAAKGPVRANCSRTQVPWKTSFSEAPEFLKANPLNLRRLPVSRGG